MEEEKAVLSFEIEEEKWEEFKKICEREGVTTDWVIEEYLRAVIRCRGIPFEYKEGKENE